MIHMKCQDLSSLKNLKKKKRKNFKMSSAAVVIGTLSFNILQANTADNKFMTLFLIFPENMIRCFIQIGNNLHGTSKPVFLKKEESYFKMLSAEIFTQSIKP